MECRKCRLNKGFAGQGFTHYECEKCGQLGWHPNTAIPKFCPTCSNKYYICQRCGADLLLEEILESKEKISLYDTALLIGCSEYSLRKYIEKGTVGSRVLGKIKKWFDGRNKA
jgi:hypothetical protein